jgi:hypothetical protein
LGDANPLGAAREFDELVRVAWLLARPALDPEATRARAGARLLQFENGPKHPLSVANDGDQEVTVTLVKEERLDASDLP